MEKIKIERLHGVYYKLSDCFGEIETSKSYIDIKRLYDTYVLDKELQEELYSGYNMNITIEKETYENGCLIDSEVILNYDNNDNFNY